MGKEPAAPRQAYAKSDLQIVGGPNGTAGFNVTPPWQGERCEAVLISVTAWGNTGTNLLYVTADNGSDLMGAGAVTLSKPDRGTVVAVNGVGTVGLNHSTLGVTQFLRVTPAAASAGQIYLTFYWQKVVDLAGPLTIPTPKPPELEEMKEGNRVWEKVTAKKPRAYLEQNPAQLPKVEESALAAFKKKIDMRGNLGKKVPE